jgi:diguanylate cyclase (GGDEF)-like protein
VNYQTYRPDERVAGFLIAMEVPVLILIAIIAGGTLVLLKVPWLRELAPGAWASMSPLTALGVLLAAGSIALSRPGSSALAQRAAETAAVLVFALGVGILGADLTGATTIFGGRMELPSPQTAAGIALVGLCLVLIRLKSTPLNAADAAGVLLLTLVMFMAAGHFFDAPFVLAEGGRVLSLQTLLCFMLLGFAIGNRLAVRGGFLSFLAHPGQGGRIARLILPFVIASPFVSFGLVGFLDRTGAMSASVTRALIVPAVVLGSLGVVGWMGHRIHGLERNLRIQSVTDDMTRTLNRRGFFIVADSIIASARRDGSSVVLCFFDLDGLKRINDTLGHNIGSNVIERFAYAVRTTFRKSDVIARVGGDEFAVLARGNIEDGRRLAERLAERVAELNATTPSQRRMAYSIGFTEIDVDSPHGLQDAMARADGYMYDDKRRKHRTDAGLLAPPLERSGDTVQAA